MTGWVVSVTCSSMARRVEDDDGARRSVFGGAFDVVDDEDVDGSARGLKFEAELVLESFAEGGGVVTVFGVRGGEGPVEGEVVEAGEAGLVDDWTGDGGHAGHGGERGGKEAERDAAAAESTLRGVGRGDVGDEAADGRQVSDDRWRDLGFGGGGGLVRLRCWCGAGVGRGMGPEIGAGHAGVDEDEGEDGGVGGLVVENEVEAVGEQGLHHEAHLVEGGVRGGPRRNVECVGGDVESAGDPGGRAGLGKAGEVVEAEGELLGSGELVGE